MGDANDDLDSEFFYVPPPVEPACASCGATEWNVSSAREHWVQTRPRGEWRRSDWHVVSVVCPCSEPAPGHIFSSEFEDFLFHPPTLSESKRGPATTTRILGGASRSRSATFTITRGEKPATVYSGYRQV